MCGIAGFFNTERDYINSKEYYQNILVGMGKSVNHRGPDSFGTFLKNHVGFAHARLSIIDLKDGSQPMKKTVDGYEYCIIYNGELYNTSKLRKRLSKMGATFDTTSDTEVVLLSFLYFGTDFVKKLNGIFAFAIYDGRHDKCLLYRDPFGVKPLFYTVKDNELIFASEIKAIFEYPGCIPEVDINGLRELFGMGPARIPGSGLYREIKEIKPGNYLTFSKYGIKVREYWGLKSKPHCDNYCDTLEKSKCLISHAIKNQMVSDVPICTFLSGGVDSSLVSSICQRELSKKGVILNTFSFDFSGNDKYFKANSFQPSQDRPYVDKMIKYIKSNHHYLSCDSITQVDMLKESVIAHDMPCMADVDSSLLYFCREVSKTQKVVLTGECADEIFGGYPWFHREEFFGKDIFPWTLDLSPRIELLRDDFKDELDLDSFVKNVYYKWVNKIEPLPEENEIETNRRQISYLNIRFFMQTLLNRMDRTSMHWGLEARVPFADKELVEYVFNIPWEMKAKDGVVKNILRQSMKNELPDEIMFRKKSPYPKTYNPYYEELLCKRIREVLDDSHSILYNFIDKKKVIDFTNSSKDYGKPWYGQLMAGPQMIAYLLQIHYWGKEYNVKII